jgi:hypothetical protein
VTDATGRGARVYPNGDEYVGDMKIGVPDGMGLYCFADGSRVQGEWSDGWPLESTHLEPGQEPDAQYSKNIPSPLDKPAKKANAGGPSVPAKKPAKKVCAHPKHPTHALDIPF